MMSEESNSNGTASKRQKLIEFSRMDPLLVHSILLTDPNKFGLLTLSGKSRAPTPSFSEFISPLTEVQPKGAKGAAKQGQLLESVQHAMRRAYHDGLVKEVLASASSVHSPSSPPMNNSSKQETRTEPFASLKKVMLELHRSIRALVPRRTDLHHSVLNDNIVNEIKYLGQALSLLQVAGQALALLEADDRAEKTKEWMELSSSASVDLPNSQGDGDDNQTKKENKEQRMKKLARFVVQSTMYLSHKTNQCQEDVDNYHFSHQLAPQIYSQGSELEHAAFEALHGPIVVTKPPRLTKEWIDGMIKETVKDEDYVSNGVVEAERVTSLDLSSSTEERQKMIYQVGWVDQILFAKDAIAVPEVLGLDVGSIQDIRQTTRLAVMGSALALLASQIAAGGVQTTSASPASRKLVQCLADQKMLGSKPSEYLERVVGAVTQLAQESAHTALSDNSKVSLESRTKRILAGEDPVLQLLDRRSREVFREMTMWKQPSTATPLHMESGGGVAGRAFARKPAESGLEPMKQFEKEAITQFSIKGFSLYAADLAEACWRATKIIKLMYTIYGDCLLDPLIKKACFNASEANVPRESNPMRESNAMSESEVS